MSRKLMIYFTLAFLAVASSASAAGARKFGLGIEIGAPTGVCGKYWINNKYAIDGALSITGQNELYLHCDFLWHDFNALPPPEEGKLPLYYGAGVVASSEKSGIRGVVGIEYLFEKYPFDLFVELSPVVGAGTNSGFSIWGGIGGRYYFGQ